MCLCVCIFREKWGQVTHWGGVVFNFSNSFSLPPSSYVFTETCQSLNIKGGPFLSTLPPCCQGVDQKGRFFLPLHKQDWALQPRQRWRRCQRPGMCDLCAVFLGPWASKCPPWAQWGFRAGLRKHALFSLQYVMLPFQNQGSTFNSLKAHMICFVFVH